MIAFSLATAANPVRQTPMPVSISALARQACVSRVHVRKMLRDAAAGYIAWSDGQDTQIVVLPPLDEAVQNFFANAFLTIRHCAKEAFDEVAATRGANVAQAS